MPLNCLAQGARSLLIEEAGRDVTPSIGKLSAVTFIEILQEGKTPAQERRRLHKLSDLLLNVERKGLVLNA